MGRIGKLPINIPAGVTVEVKDQLVVVHGAKGELEFKLRPEIELEVKNDVVLVKTRSSSDMADQIHGSVRTVIANMVKGVSDGWDKTLEISGTGYRAAVAGRNLNLSLGFSHPVVITPPNGIDFEVSENKIKVKGPDKILVGEIASQIKRIRPPDPYKAKGIKYLNEQVRRKAGKAAKAAGGAVK